MVEQLHQMRSIAHPMAVRDTRYGPGDICGRRLLLAGITWNARQ